MLKKRFFLLVFTLLLTLSLLVFFSRLTMPKYTSASREGNLIAEYYRETDGGNSHDVIFIGDCEAYSSFIPPLLWDRYGITSFVRGSPSQTLAQSYALLCETLEHETPQAVVLSVYALCRENRASEAYNRMTLDGMRSSFYKLRAVYESIGEGESMLSYFLPLLRFHSRWSELGREDIEYLIARPRVSHNGYFMQRGTVAQDVTERENGTAPYPIPEQNMKYLGKMLSACRVRGVELILVKSPTNSWRYPWYEEWSAQIREFADGHGIAYYDLIDCAETMGIDMSLDSYDGGLHLNVTGAEKTTQYFGEILNKGHNIKGKHDARTERIWLEKLNIYYKEKTNE